MSLVIIARAGSTPEMSAVFSDATLLEAALAFEAALARGQAHVGLVDAEQAQAIVDACRVAEFDVDALSEAAAHAGTLAIPLVARLRTLVTLADPVAAALAHRGATSQDVADTALVLQAKAGLELLRRDLRMARDAAAALARKHVDTAMVGRTLLQAALPISFGLKASHWMTMLDASAIRLEREGAQALALQFGGAAGTRAGLDGLGAAVAEHMASALGLANPPLPWHADRTRLVGLGGALAILTGAVGKIARDVSLLAQSEVAEAFEPRVEGRGGSSAMAHKRNPTGCQAALSAAVRAPGLAATMLATLPAEHERGLGGWQSDAPVLGELFGLAHVAVCAIVPVLQGLEIDATAMARNLAAAQVGTDRGEAAALVAAALLDHDQETC